MTLADILDQANGGRRSF